MKWFFFILVSLGFSFVRNETTDVQLKIYGVTQLKGNLMIAVYENASQFPKFGKGDINIVHDVVSKNPSVKISDLKIGKTYALAVFHDVNGNKYLDKNFLGMPEEKYGFSNGARGTFGPPYYSDAIFTVSRNQKMSITIR